MERVDRRLQEVEGVRQARLEAQQYCFQLEQARNELAHKQAVLDSLQQQMASQTARSAGSCSAEALQEARLQAADYKYKLQLTELELAKQLDALQELQWQVECVVAQLGLQQPQGAGEAGNGGGEAAAAGALDPQTASAGVDHMLLLSKVEELCAAQLELKEYKRRLEVAEAALARSQARQLPGEHAPADRHSNQHHGIAVPAEQDGQEGQGGQESCSRRDGNNAQLLMSVIQENELLRQKLGEAEEQFRSLERDYEVELLTKTCLQQQPAGGGLAEPPSQAERAWQFDMQQQQAARGSKPCRHELQSTARPASARANRSQGGPPNELEPMARQRLEFRLQEKDTQLARLRGVLKELEAKLIAAYKRQADMAMKESSWREQEAQDRRIAQLDEEKARLAFATQAAEAEAEAARKEAAVQRRLAKRLQQQLAAAAEQGGGGQGSSQMLDLLQKRVKVLEAQNIRLRLQAKSSREDEELAAAEAAAVSGRRAQQARRNSGQDAQAGSDSAGDAPGGEEGEPLQPGVGENGSPNRASGTNRRSSGSSLMDSHPVLAKWEADKRLQKKLEVLQGKLRDKTTALVSALVGRSKAEEHLQQVKAQLEQCQAGVRTLHTQLQQAQERSLPGTMVPVAKYRELLLQFEELQQRYDRLEKQHAAGQQGVLVQPAAAQRASEPSGNDHAVSQTPSGATAEALVAGTSSSLATLRTSSSKAYQPAEYGGAMRSSISPAIAEPVAPSLGQTAYDVQGLLLEKDVQLFDARLQRDQAVAEANRHRSRLHTLLDCLSPHPQDAPAAAAISEARQAAGLPQAADSGPGAVPAAVAGKAGAGGGRAKRQQPSVREQELLDTISLLKSALERTKKGLESGVSSSKYMQAVDKAKRLKLQCQKLEEQVEDAAKVRDELARVQQQLGTLHGTCSALKSQLKAAKEQQEEAAAAREHTLRAQVSELERTLRERDAQMEDLKTSMQQVDEEVGVLVAEGLRPADLIQELLVLRPRLRELEEHNAALTAELAAFDEQFLQDMEALKAEHELLRQQCGRWEEEIRQLCERHGEPLPLGMK